MQSNRMKEFMKLRGVSQMDLYKEIGIPPSTLSHIANGKIHCFPGWRRRISEALGVPESEIFPEGVDGQ